MTVVGELALWIALPLALWAAAASLSGRALRRPELVASGVRAIYAVTGMVVVASLGLWAALLAHDFSLDYVAAHTTVNTPTPYLIVAFWAGPGGAMLAWALALAICGSVAVSGASRFDAELRPVITGVFAFVLVVVVGAAIFGSNPFDRAEWVPADGRGLQPQLQNPWAALHPPAMYAGYAATAAPFAYAVAAIVTRSAGIAWLAAVRRWSLASWVLLTVGIAVGMRWLYIEPALHVVWPRHKLALVAILPWLVNAVAVARGASSGADESLDRPVAALAAGAFLASVLAAGAIRQSGEGVHPFVRAPGAGWVLVGAALVTAIPVYSSLRRLPSGGRREAAGRRRRSVGGYVASVGLVLLLAGLGATRFWTYSSVQLRAGESAELTDPYGGRWRFVSQGVSRDQGPNYVATGVALDAWRGREHVGIISSEERQYFDGAQRPTFDPTFEPGIHSTPRLDVYIALAEIRGDAAQVRVGFNPLVAWIWLGWMLVASGGVIAVVSRDPSTLRGASSSHGAE